MLIVESAVGLSVGSVYVKFGVEALVSCPPSLRMSLCSLYPGDKCFQR